MGHEDDKRTAAGERPVRRTYHPPRLLVYGVLRDLTTGGSGAKPEIGSKSKNKQRP